MDISSIWNISHPYQCHWEDIESHSLLCDKQIGFLQICEVGGLVIIHKRALSQIFLASCCWNLVYKRWWLEGKKYSFIMWRLGPPKKKPLYHQHLYFYLEPIFTPEKKKQKLLCIIRVDWSVTKHLSAQHRPDPTQGESLMFLVSKQNLNPSSWHI
jgi:hypothetical protein